MLEAAGKDRDTGVTIIYNTAQKIYGGRIEPRRDSVNKRININLCWEDPSQPVPPGKVFFLVSASGASEDGAPWSRSADEVRYY